jgi:hypothetical protein
MNGPEVRFQAEKFCDFFPRSGCSSLFSAFRWWAWGKDFAHEERRAIAQKVREELVRSELALDHPFTADASGRLDAALIAWEASR